MDFTQDQKALTQAGGSPRPAPFTRGQMESKGIRPESSTLDLVLRPYEGYVTDQEQLDKLLVRRCVGEGMDGFVHETPKTCVGGYNQRAVTRLLQRINTHRRQVLELMQARTKKSPDQVKRAYRDQLLKLLVCGGWFQDDAGQWEVKKCE